MYSTGDRAVRHGPGRLEFLGRIDPVVSVSGQLVSLAEVRDVLLEHPFLRSAEVVSVADPPLRAPHRRVRRLHIRRTGRAEPRQRTGRHRPRDLGGPARPQTVVFVDEFGTDLADDARRRALAVVAASVNEATAHATWSQVQAAATL